MKILIVAKHSKYEWEKKRLSLNHQGIMEKYAGEHANVEAILEAHEYQLKVRNLFDEVMPHAYMTMMDMLDGTIEGYDLVIVLGGDNSFTYVSHYVGNIPILGVNSDPKRSEGYITQWAIEEDQDVFDLVECLDFDHLNVEDWARLEVTVNGKILPPATSEIYLGERQRNNMSRHVLEYEGSKYEQKCSGLVVATGAGSTGWYRSANRELNSWDVTAEQAKFVVTEPYNIAARLNYTGIIGGQYSPEITVHSLNDSEGIVSIDSWEEFAFGRGATAKIFLGAPLHVAFPVVESK